MRISYRALPLAVLFCTACLKEKGNCPDTVYSPTSEMGYSGTLGATRLGGLVTGDTLMFVQHGISAVTGFQVKADSVIFLAPMTKPCRSRGQHLVLLTSLDAKDTFYVLKNPGWSSETTFQFHGRSLVNDSQKLDAYRDSVYTFQRIYAPGDTFQVTYGYNKGLRSWKTTFDSSDYRLL